MVSGMGNILLLARDLGVGACRHAHWRYNSSGSGVHTITVGQFMLLQICFPVTTLLMSCYDGTFVALFVTAGVLFILWIALLAESLINGASGRE